MLDFRLKGLMKLRQKAMKVFLKMISRLEKANEKLAILRDEVIEERQRLGNVATSAFEEMQANNNAIEKLKSFVEQ